MHRTLARLRAARRDDRGFTLIELLIVIIILGVLAAVVVFSVRGITDNGDQAACETEHRIVATALEAYYASQTPPAYPAANDLEALVDGGFLQTEPDEYVTGFTFDPVNGSPIVAPGAGTC